MTPHTLDCRGFSLQQTGLTILKTYNASESGAEFTVLIDTLNAGLRMWLIEAGAKHWIEFETDQGVCLTVHRSLSPAQGSIPGLHHIVAAGDSVWACERDRRLLRVDAESGEVAQVAEIAVKASHLAVDADQKWIFVADPGANELLAIASADLSVQHRWVAPGGPQLPLVTDDGIVCVTGGGANALTIVRPRAQGYEVQTIEVDACPHDPLTTPDGKRAFIPCAGDGSVVSVDLEDGRILGRYKAGDGCAHLALHPDGERLYSANTFDGTVSCLSVEGDLLGQEESGPWAHQPAISPDGRFVYVANFFNDTISVFDPDSMEKIASLDTEPYPHGLDISPDGRWIVATGFSSDQIRIYNAATITENVSTKSTRIDVGRGSSHIAFLADQKIAFVACSVDDHLARLDLDAMTCTQRISLN
ncbi:MAG: beta-propeller fold lactonase family protein [Proteobacteria bacterium]|jgi:YVTN family beta-propeller protein|nr:beta-propeller fold lactonase family protein [Pseudomonadota bacterium]